MEKCYSYCVFTDGDWGESQDGGQYTLSERGER